MELTTRAQDPARRVSSKSPPPLVRSMVLMDQAAWAARLITETPPRRSVQRAAVLVFLKDEIREWTRIALMSVLVDIARSPHTCLPRPAGRNEELLEICVGEGAV